LNFFEYIKRCREENSLTQEHLVQNLYEFDSDNFSGLDTSTLSRWERGTTQPKFSKQVGIIKYFQELGNEAFPCMDHLTLEEIDTFICRKCVENILGKNKQIILNFPSAPMDFQDMHVYRIEDPLKFKPAYALLMDMHKATNVPYTQNSLETFEAWTVDPNSFFLACVYKNAFVGLLFTVKLKQSIFDQLMNFEIRRSDIKEKDFASVDEEGSVILLASYAINTKAAIMLFAMLYAYLIKNQKKILEVGVMTSFEEVKKVVKNMKLRSYKSKVLEDGVKVDTYRAELKKVLASENVAKMIFSE